MLDPKTNVDKSPVNRIFFGIHGLRPGWGLLLFFFLFALLSQAGRALIHSLQVRALPGSVFAEVSPGQFFRTEILLFLAAAVTTLLMSRLERFPVARYGFGGRASHFGAGLLCGFVSLTLLILLLRSAGLLRVDGRLLGGATAVQFGVVWFGGFLLVGLFEETFSRGYLQYTLSRGLTSLFRAMHSRHSEMLGFWSAALLLSALFGFGHRSNPGESPFGLLSAALAGLVFVYSLWRTGSLWWAIGFHTSWDWAQSFLYGVADSGVMVRYHLLATHPVGATLLSGGATGPEGSILMVPILALVALGILLTLRSKPSRPAPLQ